MPLFQISVLNKYLAEQDKQVLEDQYGLFKTYFLNSTIQKNILASKEEEFQEGFLRELFVKIFGYTINPNENYNLKTELKNVKDSKKADGAIVENEKVLAIIELKGTDTVNLNQIEIQAFGYKNNQDGCKYVITSNFQKIRFYIDNAIEFLEWDLFKLDFENFKLLYLCLSKENIFKNLAAIIKAESITVEENITKQLYKEYSGFRKALFNNIVEINSAYDKLLLFKKTQKLLDRFLFLFFAEDKMLVPPNSVRKILEQWNSLKEMDAYQPLYGRFKLYFGYLNVGHQGKLHEIFAYNGGLFAPDEVLDDIIVDDAILYEATLSLSNYNYNSEVDVNILGHIFEHSLTEIEELENEIINNETLDSNKSKRKKDGVFYTPKYITKYIVENTVGTLCKKKKIELNIEDSDYHPLQKKKTVKILLANLHTYREWLLQITILDPACGSGAFLNQALEFLIAEHKSISELEANITGSSILFDVENSILENNLFGVDINEESVEIAKLSLWLRTAKKGRKLNSLNNNIKCGNSLIDDVTVAGDKAFIWEKEFPQVFGKYNQPINIDKKDVASRKVGSENEKETYTFTAYKESESSNITVEKITNQDDKIVNTDFNILNETAVEFLTEKKAERGFDVVIGNPPYATKIFENAEKAFYNKSYSVSQYQIDLYILFIQKGTELLKEGGHIGFITPNSWLKNMMMSDCRLYLLNNIEFNSIVPNMPKVFPDASVDSMIFIGTKKSDSIKPTNIFEIKEGEFLLKHQVNTIEYLKNEKYIFTVEANNQIIEIINILNSQSNKLEEYFEISRGINPYDSYRGQSQEIIKSKAYHSAFKKDSTFVPEIRGKHAKRYFYKWDEKHFISYGDWLAAPRNETYFKGDRIIFREILGKYFECTIVKEDIKIDRSLYIAIPKPNNQISINYTQALLASRLLAFYFRYTSNEFDTLFPKIRLEEFKKLPIKIIDKDKQLPLSQKVELMLKTYIQFDLALSSFLNLLSAKFKSININTKLEKWYNLSFADFSKELNKQKIKLTLAQESEWLSFFELEKQKALSIKNEIDFTDAEIDKMVYALYGLSKEEIKIVEGK